MIRVVLPELPATRNERGQYQSAQAEQYDRNRKFSEYLLSQVGQRIKSRVESGPRASASTGRLLRASIDARNALVTKEFVGVGRQDWLDRSPVNSYWRIFEEGTHGFVGTPLFITKGAPFPVAHGVKPGLRTLSGGRVEELLDGDVEPGAKSSGMVAFVRHEIQPANIYHEMARANLHEIESFSLQSARAFLFKAMEDTQRVVRDAGPRTGPFPWSSNASYGG